MPKIKKSVAKKVKVGKPKQDAFSVLLVIGNGRFEAGGETILEALNKFSIESIGDLGAGGILTVKKGDGKYELGFTPFQFRMLLANPDARAIFEQKALMLLQ